MNCTHAQEWLDDLLLAQPDEILPTEVAKHIAVCHRCRIEYEVATRTLASIRPSHQVKASEQLKERIMNSLGDMNVRPETAKTHRFNVWKPALALAATVLVCVSATVIYLRNSAGNTPPAVSGFSLFAKAWAAEEATFTGDGMIHIVNEIVVKPIANANIARARWTPLYALDADGKARVHQLKLGAQPGEAYTVDDQAWYDPATRRFVHLLSVGGTALFANSYDGHTIYSLEPGPDGVLHVVAKPVTEDFRAPESPAQFLGVSVGLPSKIDEMDKSTVLQAGEVRLDDGSMARVVTSCLGSGKGAPKGIKDNYFAFRIRESDNTIAEMEWMLKGEGVLLIRRLRTEHTENPDIPWDLGKLDTVLKTASQSAGPRTPDMLGVFTDMAISDVTVQHMAEKSDFETYVFASAPPWTATREISDILDVASPPHRMFIISYPGKDKRHIVLVQSYTYNGMGKMMVKSAQLAYQSPNGIKVWSSPRGSWLAQILLESARHAIKDPPAEDRTGYLLETPSGTFPALAINGQLSESELHALVDSLTLAKQYKGE